MLPSFVTDLLSLDVQEQPRAKLRKLSEIFATFPNISAILVKYIHHVTTSIRHSSSRGLILKRGDMTSPQVHQHNVDLSSTMSTSINTIAVQPQ